MTAFAAVLVAAAFTRTLERVSTMDPVMTQSAYDARAVKLVYESVLEVDYEARPYKIVAGACELPEVSEDGLVYRFRVSGSGETNGTGVGPRAPRLTAREIVATLEKIRDPKNAAPNGWTMRKVKEFRVLGEMEFEVELRERQHVFPWMLTTIGIAKADGSGTGAYELKSWRKNHEMVFRARLGKLGLEGFDEVRYLVVDDVSTQWLMFLRGETDLLGEISRDIWDSVVDAEGRLDANLAAQGIRLVETPTLDTMYLGINMEDKVLGRNRKLRQALNCAFDFPAWKKFYNGRVEESDGPIPHGVKGRLETPFAYGYDLGKAKRLLAEAGYPEGIDPKTGRRLVLELAIGKATQESREAGELIVSFFEKVGVKLELSFSTWDAFLKALSERRVQLYFIGWVGDYPDAENFLQLFHSSNVSPGANHSNYVNAEFDREYDAAMACREESERMGHWKRCQEIVREDCPWVYMHYPKSFSLVHRRVGNYLPGAFPYGNERFYKVVGE